MRGSADPAAPPPLPTRRLARIIWLSAGLILVGTGIVGIFVPLLPTTDFMLLALPCFARSSPRLEAWLLHHPRFGPGLRAWRNERAIPRRAKIMSCIGMAIGFAFFWAHVRPSWGWSFAIAAFLLFWMLWIIRRPEPATAQ